MTVRDRASRFTLRGLLLTVLLLPLHPSTAAATAPPPYEGELGVCNGLSRETSLGASVSQAVEKLLRGFGASEPDLLGSIYRTAIENAIELCGQPAAEVLAGAVRAGVPVDIIVTGALDAGVSASETRGLLREAGVAPALLAAAVTEAQRYGDDKGPLFPSVTELSSGLGGPFSNPLVNPPGSQFVP
jgi:hypothetical protein